MVSGLSADSARASHTNSFGARSSGVGDALPARSAQRRSPTPHPSQVYLEAPRKGGRTIFPLCHGRKQLVARIRRISRIKRKWGLNCFLEKYHALESRARFRLRVVWGLRNRENTRFGKTRCWGEQ